MDKIIWPIEKLKNWDRNPREIKTEKFKDLKDSLQKEGQLMPLLVDTRKETYGTVMGGNMTLRALKELGYKDVWVEPKEPTSDAHAFELAIKHNMGYGQYQKDILLELAEQFKGEIDLNKLSVDLREPSDLQEFLDQFTPTEEDEVPEVSDKPAISKLGEVYQLGRHRLMVGDSTKIEDVEKLMDGKKADMVFTSPPYNANAKTGEGDIFNNKGNKQMYQGEYKDDMTSEEYIQLAKNALELCFINTEGFIFWNVSYNANSRFEYIKQIEDRLEYLVEQICWRKSSAIPIKGSLRRAWEPIYLFSTYKTSLGTDKIETNIWEISNTNSQIENHKACFPVALPVKGINLVQNSKNVYDPFGGSGTTLIACEQTNRTCYMMELDPKYTDVIRKRYAKFIGKEDEWQAITPKL